MKRHSDFRYVVLAGERPGGNALAREFHLPASVLVSVGGESCLNRVLNALQSSELVHSGVICGPAREAVDQSDELRKTLSDPDVRWLEPETGPAASTGTAITILAHFPILITTADHALLNAGIIDDFCNRAADTDMDLVVGLVPYPLVRESFPHSRRTVLRFSDGHYCGSNLFAVLNENGARAIQLWQQVESERKKPWKIARRLKFTMMLRYLTGRLSLAQGLRVLSEKSGCRVGHVVVEHVRAAVDVDSKADWALADRLLREDNATSRAETAVP